jgi:hypothetical protein
MNNPSRYVYLQSTMHSPSLRYDIFSPEATTATLTDLTEARPVIRPEMNVKTLDGRHQISGLVDCVATLGFVEEDFVRCFSPSSDS